MSILRLSFFRLSAFRNHGVVWILLVIFSFSCVPSISLAQQPTATINTLSGTVLVNGQVGNTGTVLNAGDVIETQAGASVVLELSDGSLLEFGENTKADMAELAQTATGARVSLVKLMWGRIRAKLSPVHQRAGSSFDIETPNALVGVKFSEPDIEVSYNLETIETVAFAYTVALAVKNLITNEEMIIPVGSMAIITALGIKIMAGAAIATGVIGAESAAGGTTAAGATTGMGTATKVAIGAGALAAAGGVAAVAASSGDGATDSDGETTASEEDPIEAIVASVNVVCIRFQQDDSYWVDASIVDPQALVARATLSGSSGSTSLTYNRFPRHPGWWWADPTIFISQGSEPNFPLNFTVHITFKDGTTRDVSKTVTTWEWAQ